MYLRLLLAAQLFMAPVVQANAQTAAIAQKLLRGTVLNKETNQPLAYVSVGVLKKPQGTITDTLGHFAFTITDENLSDSLQFSIVGYSSLRMAVRDFANAASDFVKLTIDATQLATVLITSSTSKSITETIGRQGSGKLTQLSIHYKTSADETVGSEMGMLYKTDKPDAVLKDFNFYVSANNFNYIKFRVNVYALKNGLPDRLISPQQIFATLENFKTGWTKINLEPYNIKAMPEMVITVQWIESRMDRKEAPVTIVPFTPTPFSKNCFARIASQDKWIKKGISLSNFITLAYQSLLSNELPFARP